MTRHRYLILFFVFLAAKLFAQGPGKITVMEDQRVKELVTKNIVLNMDKETINGYRVQLHFGGDRKKAQKIKTDFLQNYPEVSAYELYQQPNFKIRVGDFRTRLEAQKFLKELSATFPGAYIVNDDINLPKL
jgi:hypothetical protein